MATPFIRIEKQELGYSKVGDKLTILGQIIGYENCNGIAVVKVEDQSDLVFLEINAMQSDLNQIYEPEDIKNLNELWATTNVVDLIASNYQPKEKLN